MNTELYLCDHFLGISTIFFKLIVLSKTICLKVSRKLRPLIFFLLIESYVQLFLSPLTLSAGLYPSKRVCPCGRS